MADDTAALFIDIGNTSIRWAVYEGGWGALRRLATREAGRLAAEVEAKPEVAVMCSVVAAAADSVTEQLEGRGFRVLVLGRNLEAKMPVSRSAP